MNNKYVGTTVLGVVVALDDDKGLKSNEDKVKVRIPSIHGPMKREDLPAEWSETKSWVDDDHLPWIPICYPLGTSFPSKSILKEKEIVYIHYTGSDSSAPIVIGTAARLVEE